MSAQLIHDLPWTDYTSGDWLGSSALADWGKSSLEAWSREHLEDRYSGKASRWTAGGSYLDAIVPPTPDIFPKRFAVKPDGMSFATKDGKAWRDAQYGHEIVTEAQARNANAALPLVREALGIMESVFSATTRYQVTLRGEVDGIKLQTRPDMMIGHHVPDLKYVNPEAFDSFERTFESSRYCIQAGLFFGLVREATGETPVVCFLLAESETDLPRCRVVQIPQRVSSAAWDRVRSICAEIAEVKASEAGFVSRVKFDTLNLPEYVERRLGIV